MCEQCEWGHTDPQIEKFIAAQRVNWPWKVELEDWTPEDGYGGDDD